MEDLIQWLQAGPAADYQQGVQLLAKHSKNRTLINHLLKKDSQTNREKLTYELLKAGLDGDLQAVHQAQGMLALHLDAQAAEVIAGAVPTPPVPLEPDEEMGVQASIDYQRDAQVNAILTTPQAPAASEPDQVPEAVRSKVEAITERMQTLYQERCTLSNLLDAASDEEGKQLVADILRLQEQYNELAERRRQLLAGEATGQPAPGTAVPDQEAPAPADPEAPEAPAVAPVDVVKLGDELRNVRSNLSKAKGKLAKKPDDVALQEKVAKLTLEKEQLELQLKKATE